MKAGPLDNLPSGANTSTAPLGVPSVSLVTLGAHLPPRGSPRAAGSPGRTCSLTPRVGAAVGLPPASAPGQGLTHGRSSAKAPCCSQVSHPGQQSVQRASPPLTAHPSWSGLLGAGALTDTRADLENASESQKQGGEWSQAGKTNFAGKSSDVARRDRGISGGSAREARRGLAGAAIS